MTPGGGLTEAEQLARMEQAQQGAQQDLGLLAQFGVSPDLAGALLRSGGGILGGFAPSPTGGVMPGGRANGVPFGMSPVSRPGGSPFAYKMPEWLAKFRRTPGNAFW